MPHRQSVLHLLASDHRRGAESFAVELDQRLTERGWRSGMRAVRTSHGPNRFEMESLGRSWRDPRGLLAYARTIRDYDIVVAHGSDSLWTASLGSLSGGPPFVYVNIGDPRFWTADRTRRVRVTALLRRAERVAAISPRSAAALDEHLRVSRDRIVVIPNGRSSSRFAPRGAASRAEVRRELGLPVDGPVVGFMGALSPEKRVSLAVEAVSAWPGAHLALAGEGPDRKVLEELAQRLMPGRAHWLGVVAQPERVLVAFDVLVLTSRSEGVPGVLVEAGLTGLPAVTADVGFASDVVIDGVTGRLVDPLDRGATTTALQEAVRHAGSWGAAARQHCLATYDLERVVDTWDALLLEIVKGQDPAS